MGKRGGTALALIIYGALSHSAVADETLHVVGATSTTTDTYVVRIEKLETDVVDGDTIGNAGGIKGHSKEGERIRIRWPNTDTAEKRQADGLVYAIANPEDETYAKKATQYVKTRIEQGDTIDLVVVGTGRRGRPLAHIFVNGEDVELGLIVNGFAYLWDGKLTDVEVQLSDGKKYRPSVAHRKAWNDVKETVTENYMKPGDWRNYPKKHGEQLARRPKKARPPPQRTYHNKAPQRR